MVYADDAHLICQSADIATLIETEYPAVQAKWSLTMNTSKTEHTIVHISLTARSNRITRDKDEDWRMAHQLGFLLGDAEDVSRRIKLATAALTAFRKFGSGHRRPRKLRACASTPATYCQFCYTTTRLGPSPIPCYVALRISIVHSSAK